MINYTKKDIINAVSPSYYSRGKDYHHQGRVSNINLQGELLSGHVQGSRLYSQLIFLSDSKINGDCTCPVGGNCKHVVAVLLAAMDGAIDYANETILQPEDKIVSENNNNTYNNNVVLFKADQKNTNNYAGLEVISDYHTANWLEQLDAVISANQSSKKSSNTQIKNLIYILKISDKGTPCIIPYTVALKKDGSYSKTTKAYNVENITSRRKIAEYIDTDDHFILHRIAQERSVYVNPEDGYEIDYEKSADLLTRILKTGKCRWKELNGIVLSEGESKPATLSWRMLDDGKQEVECYTDNKNECILKLTPPWYVNDIEGICGRLNTGGIPDKIVGAILKAPALKPIEIEAVRKRLAIHESSNIAIPVPSKFEKTEIIQGVPIPHLYLYGQSISNRNTWNDDRQIEIALARISFDYGGNKVTLGQREDIITSVQGNTLLQHKRDYEYEKKVFSQLLDTCKFQPIITYKYHYNITANMAKDFIIAANYDLEDPDLAEEWMELIPQLQKNGWQIEIDKSFPYNITHPDDDWYAQIDDSSGVDWFGLELGVSIDGKQTNLLPILLSALKNKRHAVNMDKDEPSADQLWYFPLPNGSRLALPAIRVWTMMSVLKNLYNFENLDADGSLRLSRLEAANLADIENVMQALNMRWFGGEKIRKLGQKLKDFSGIKAIESPKNFKADLRNYQKDGLNWMQFLREYDLGGILADDMGLGKTIQALAYIMHEKQENRLKKPILVVAPTSVLVNWRLEVERFASTLKTLVLHGSDRSQHFDVITEYDLVLTTYPLLTRDKEILLKQEFHTIILDEAHYIKNSKAKNTQVACQIKADHRICMTGTPIENHLGELWSQFNFLLPGFLGDEKKFRQFYRNPIEKDGNTDRNAALVRRIKPFILRRTKDQIATELPPKTIVLKVVSLEKAQRDLYETIRVSMQKKVRDEIAKKGFARSHIMVLDALLKLRQTCCDPRILKMDAAKKVKESAKLKMLMDMLPEMVEEGRKILLFSQFVSMLNLIENELNKKKLQYVKLTGQTKDRKTPIERFQNGEVPIFLISLKAGGTGLNLTAADTVIHYDPWWNPAAENQATDRAHRIGQDKPVFVYKLLTEGTVEEKILQMQEKKHALAEGIFNPNSKSSGALTADDINALFDPLE